MNLEQLLSPSPGGVGRYAAKLAVHLVRLGVDIEPVVALHRREEVLAAWESFALAGVPQPRRMALPRPLLYDSWHLLDWPPLSRGPGADVVHAPSLAVPPKNGKPLVVSVHDAGPWLFPGSFGRRGRWFHAMGARAAGRRADVVLTGSQAAAAELVQHLPVPAERIRVVPYGVDPPLVPPDEPQVRETLRRYRLEGVTYVLWVGSLEPRKGVGTLVAAMARRARAAGAPHLVLAGYSGWQNAVLIDPTDRAALGPALHQLGRLPEADLQALYTGAAVFAFPSAHEGFGLPVLEAMAAGVPVVASDIPALREVAGGAAELVGPGDVGGWADAIGALVGSGPQREELARRGRARAAEFSWAKTAAATAEIYRELLA